ncbi:MAG: 50S ribosomal protein L23 [Cyanobacteria bacterium]|nr:50S ribosomal protein L23 [Cyanobacteriota bacterium]MDA1021278.1 50S ribosomal protein L23 [Cyanobacteriota bacterium]
MSHALEEVLKKPLITEKSSIAASTLDKYTFEIPKWATKNHVKEAFTKYFPNHKILKVNTGSIFGKAKRSRKGYSNPVDRKKAIITVEGEHIDYFPEV